MIAASLFLCRHRRKIRSRLGAIYTFTGAMAFLNEGIVDGHLLAIDEINKSGGLLGRKIELIGTTRESRPGYSLFP